MRLGLSSIVAGWMLCLCISGSLIFAQPDTSIKFERRYTGKGYALCGSCSAPASIGSTAVLVRSGEPGDRVVITGTIYRADGVTPDSGITLFLYQADAGGYYHRPKEDVFHPGIFGWIRTGKDGKYEIRTVKPYPEILAPNEPAHIHAHIFGEGIQEHFLHEFWFKGDHGISAEDRDRFLRLGEFSPVVTLTKGSDGVWRGIRNIRVRPAPQWRYEEE